MAYVKSPLKPPLSFPTVSGDICSFVSPYAGLALKSHVVTIPPTLAGISEINIVAPSTNLWGGGYMLSSFRKMNLTTFTYDSDYLRFGAGDMSGYKVIIEDIFKPNTQYTMIFEIKKTSGANTNLSVLYTDNSRTIFNMPSGDVTEKQTLVVTTTEGKTVKAITGANGSGQTYLYYNECCLLEGVKTADDFVPFNFFANIQIGSIVYGGIYDAVTGIFIATHMSVNLDMNWTLVSGTTNLFQSDNISGFVLPSTNYGLFDGLCGVYTIDSYANVNEQTNISLGVSNTGIVRVYDTDYSSATDFYNYIKDKLLVGTLATPMTLQLSPARVETLLGKNDIFADTGDTTLQYPKFG